MLIKKIKAIRVFDSRGIPTLKTFVYTDNHIVGASVPSGTSAGKREAVELRDKSKDYLGYDVSKAIKNVNNVLAPKLKGEFLLDQVAIDEIMIDCDGTDNKSKLGANALLSVSMAVCRAASKELEIPLYDYISRLNPDSKRARWPKPFFNIINGGEHAGNELAIQEFKIYPRKNKPSQNMKIAVEVYLTLKNILEKKYGGAATNVGYEGGFAPNISDTYTALDLIEEAIKKAGYSRDVYLSLDCAASSYYNEKTKRYTIDGQTLTRAQMLDYYDDLLKSYKKIKSIEDPFSEDDKASWRNFTKKHSSKINIVGDDLLVTNPILIKDAIRKKYCNSLLLKPNQIGTITESIDAFNLAKSKDWSVVVSHRSGETEDEFIADLAYGLKADFVKFGAPARSERNSKYNRLLEIEEIYSKL